MAFYVAFAGLTLFVLSQQSASDWRGNWNVAATIGSFSGPFTGAIARHFQACFLEFSSTLLPYSLLFLMVAVVFQFVPLPFRPWQGAFRLVMWCLGLLGWFGSGILSFAHALS